MMMVVVFGIVQVVVVVVFVFVFVFDRSVGFVRVGNNVEARRSGCVSWQDSIHFVFGPTVVVASSHGSVVDVLRCAMCAIVTIKVAIVFTLVVIFSFQSCCWRKFSVLIDFQSEAQRVSPVLRQRIVGISSGQQGDIFHVSGGVKVF